MLNYFRRRYSLDTVAEECAKLGLLINEEVDASINVASKELGVPITIVKAEYQYLRVYCIETALQNASRDNQVVEGLVARFREAILRQAKENGTSKDYWAEYNKRVAIYDEAWQDLRGVGWAVAMGAALSKQIKSEDALAEVLPLWISCASLMIEVCKYLRSIRIFIA